MLWELGLALLFALALPAAGVKEGGVRLDSGGKTEAVGGVRLLELLKTPTRAGGSGFELGRRRTKRSVFLHSGVRICPQETIDEVLASHQAYYQLRVCQEAVWEAFRIFFDRIPGTAEYQRWVHTCQHESLCISDLAKNFSSSEEHMSMIQRRMSRVRDRRPPSRGSVTPAPTRKVPEIAEVRTVAPSAPPPAIGTSTGTITTGTATAALSPASAASPSPALDQTQPGEEVEEDSELPNVVPESPVEQIVEFSIDLVDPGYRELLDDPDSPQYIDLAHHLQDQMQHVFDKLPGFKDIHVLGIRPGGISVHYSLVFEINSPKINSENPETATVAPESSSDSGLREMVTKALREEASLPIDLNSLNFEPEAVLLPALTSTSSAEVVNESSEPDSHNEFEVSTDEPEEGKPRLVVPLTPLEKENALVTLLDPTAVPDDETTAATGGMAENSELPPASEDITDETEAIYVSEPEPSDDEGVEEELLIISHEIETIHHNETGELVRDYFPTPPVIPELEEDGPFISLSPNVISEEDLIPVDEDGDKLILDVVEVTTTQILLTTASAGEEPSDVGLPVTTMSAITAQTPTEPTVTLDEDEEINALPNEEEVDLGILETETERLEPEAELAVITDEEVLEVLQPTPEQAEVSEPEEEKSEVSEPDMEAAVSEPKEVVVEVPRMEEKEIEISVEVSEPEEAELDNIATEVLTEVSEKPPEPDVESELGGVDDEILQPEEEVVKVSEETVPEVSEEMGPEVSQEMVPKVTEETLPKAPEETEPKAPEETEPKAPEETAPKVSGETVPQAPEETIPKVLEETVSEISEETEPEVPEETVPKVPEETVPEISEETAPKVPEETVPKVPEETVPAISEETAPKVPEETVPKVLEETVPEISEEIVPKVPEETLLKVPEETLPKVPEETLLKVPVETAPEISEETVPEISEETVPKLPEETVPEILEKTAPKVPEETVPKVPEETVPEISEETLPKVPEETVPENSQGTLHKVPEETASKVPEEMVPKVLEETVPKIPEETVPKVPEETVLEISEETLPKVPEETLPKVPEETVPEISGETLPKVPEETVPKVPEETVPEISEETLPKVPEETVPEISQETLPKVPEEEVPKVPEETVHEVSEEIVPEVSEEMVPEVLEETVHEVSEETLPKVPEDTVHKVSEEIVPKVPEETLPKVPEETVSEVPEETVSEVPEETAPEDSEETAPEDSEETLPEVLEEMVHKVPEETLPEVSEEVVPGVPEETAPEVSEPEAEVFEAKAGDVVKPVEEEFVKVPEEDTEESEKEVVEILEAPAPDEGVIEPEPDSAPGGESHVTELTETGVVEVETAESVEEQEGVSEPSEKGVEVVGPAPEAEREEDSDEIQQPEEDVVQGVKPEREVVVAPVPHDKPVDISEPQLPSEVEKEVEQDEVAESLEPEEASEAEKGTVDIFQPAEELPGVSEPESKDKTVVAVPEPEEGGIDVPEPNPEEGIVEVLEPEPEEDSTEPPAESIKILQPVDSIEDLHFGEDDVQVVEDNEFLPPVGPDYHRPLEEDNLPIIPIDSHPSVEEAGEPDHEYPIIDDFYIEEEVDSIDTQVESDSTAVTTTTEAARGDLQSETTSAVAEVTAPDRRDTTGRTEVAEHLPEETQESDSSSERDVSVTSAPVSESFLTPPASSVDASEVSSPSPAVDSGLFEVAEQSVIPSPPESSEDDSAEPEAESEQSEPGVIIIDEDLEEAVQRGGESPTSPPAAPEDVIDEAVKDLAVELDRTDVPATEPPDEGSGFVSAVEEHTTVAVTTPPPVRYLTTPAMTRASHGRELVVFFSLRVTNMNFSEDLFNKTSTEYRSLETTFLDVLLPFLQANLTGFKKLEILNFRKGSVVVNSKMKFAKSVPYNITEAVHCVLEEFCSAAARNLHIQIDTHSLDVEPADQADPCKFQACDEFSRCVVNGRSREAQCVCETGFLSVDGRPCQSLCVLRPDYCHGGECRIVPGHGAVCRYKDGSSLPGPAS